MAGQNETDRLFSEETHSTAVDRQADTDEGIDGEEKDGKEDLRRWRPIRGGDRRCGWQRTERQAGEVAERSQRKRLTGRRGRRVSPLPLLREL